MPSRSHQAGYGLSVWIGVLLALSAAASNASAGSTRSLAEREALFPAPGEPIRSLEALGLTAELNGIAEAFAAVDGADAGQRAFEYRWEALAQVDLERLVGLPRTTLHAHSYFVAGRGLFDAQCEPQEILGPARQDTCGAETGIDIEVKAVGSAAGRVPFGARCRRARERANVVNGERHSPGLETCA